MVGRNACIFRYNSLLPMYYRGAGGAIVVYDITNMDSYKRATAWVRELQVCVIVIRKPIRMNFDPIPSYSS